METIINKTGQGWKLRAHFIGMALCGIGILGANYLLGVEKANLWFAIMSCSMLLGVGSIVFAANSIKCPKCGCKLYWYAVSKQNINAWLSWLYSQASCPSCNYGHKNT